MSIFKLMNMDSEEWTPDQFIEIDADNEKQLRKIVLTVDWSLKTAKVETLPANQQGSLGDLFGTSKTFMLPYNIDASRFPAFYDEKIRNALEEMKSFYKAGFVNGERVGYFDFNESIGKRGEKEFKYYTKIQTIIREVPRHDIQYHWELSEIYPTAADLYLKLESCSVDLVETNLYDSEKLEMIRSILEKDCIFLIDNDTFMYQLLTIQRRVDSETKAAADTRKRVKTMKAKRFQKVIGDANVEELLNHI